ncbi:ABC transporter substrate-binding protein [Paenibacillus antarcticus]|uniref:Ferrichrome ABC transporter substrate-binding protein n=1 Tax=Paenibacillus antarcticus TaxID=253703 RepID=A0A168NBP0_9BACL|nr:ABC transporter substrate-binding protein [Paenibacillus antarcticus]OAB45619.1 ferrichrome ABC transporter substrate-binding protein [Paenibacillus antarcticus]
MKKARYMVVVIALISLMGVMLLGCTGASKDDNIASEPLNGNSADIKTDAAKESSDVSENEVSRSYTDYRGHVVDIPTAPQRVIFAGETTGDLLEIGIQPIGALGVSVKDTLYENELTQVEDVGFPINLEKVISLNPDLILVADTDEKGYESLSKIAPTIMFDTFASLDERMIELGDIFSKQQEATDWLNIYNAKAEEIWKQLYDKVLKPGETASVFTYYPGDRLFIMAQAGLPQLLYGKGGMKPTDPIQEVLDEGEGFRQISAEEIGKFAGDYIFILNPIDQEAKKSTEEMLASPIWKGLPAVKNGHVYRLDINKASSDAFTRDYMLNELSKLLGN